MSLRLVGDLAQGGGAEDVVGGAGLGGDLLTSSNYDSESEAAEDNSSFKVDAILNENAQDGEEEEKKLMARKDGEQVTCAWRRGRKSKMATDVGIMPR